MTAAHPSTARTSLARAAARTSWRIARPLLVAYFSLVLLLMIFEDRILFGPTRYPGGHWHPEGLPFEDAWFTADDGTRLHGWYAPHDRPRARILYCHGNAGNITHRADILAVLSQRVGAEVLMFDYRGYGRSEGTPNERGILRDARAARAWLAQRAGVPETDIVVMGHSLGGAVAVDLAAGDGARGLIVESSFDALPNVAAYHYPWVPVRWLMHTRLDSAGKIPRYRGPLLLAHSRDDTIVPAVFGRRLFEAANEPKTFYPLDGLEHNDPLPDRYYEALIAFLDRLPPEQPPQP